MINDHGDRRQFQAGGQSNFIPLIPFGNRRWMREDRQRMYDESDADIPVIFATTTANVLEMQGALRDVRVEATHCHGVQCLRSSHRQGCGAPTLCHGRCAKPVPVVWTGVPVMAWREIIIEARS